MSRFLMVLSDEAILTKKNEPTHLQYGSIFLNRLCSAKCTAVQAQIPCIVLLMLLFNTACAFSTFLKHEEGGFG